jgi:hypothetical protein
MQLFHGARTVEKPTLHRDLAMQPLEIRRGALAVLRHHLVAGAIKADGIAEREMEIKRKRTRG